MTGYACKKCPLAFEVGYYGYWDLSGCCSQYVCCECGTMHRIDHRNGKPDVLFALSGPILAMIDVVREDCAGRTFASLELPISEGSWRLVAELPTPWELQCEPFFHKRASGVQLNDQTCSYCGKIGRLVSNYWPMDQKGNCLASGDQCPRCGEKLELVYVSTIN